MVVIIIITITMVTINPNHYEKVRKKETKHIGWG